MNREELCERRFEALVAFGLSDNVTSCDRYGNGHINDTFMVVTECSDSTKRYILQRINTQIFKKPLELMHNIALVTDYLTGVIESYGGDPERETLHIIKTQNGENCYCDSLGSFWRMYSFIEGTVSYDQVERPQDFYQSAYSFGKFQRLLADFNANELYETIPDFHNTPLRFEHFKEAVKNDVAGRAAAVQEEINFFLEREADMSICRKKLLAGLLPLRVTHNDTKLNNILIDKTTGKGLCVIDLDTVMPGLSIFDFGDSIRFGANTASEDERDLSKVSLNLELYRDYVTGYLKGCGGKLTKEEVKMMPYGAKTMTLECGMRFLTDYLEGDVYFMVHREGHNLDRARTQIELVKDMELKWSKMEKITMEAAE